MTAAPLLSFPATTGIGTGIRRRILPEQDREAAVAASRILFLPRQRRRAGWPRSFRSGQVDTMFAIEFAVSCTLRHPFKAAMPSARPECMLNIAVKPLISSTSSTCALTPQSAKTLPDALAFLTSSRSARSPALVTKSMSVKSIRSFGVVPLDQLADLVGERGAVDAVESPMDRHHIGVADLLLLNLHSLSLACARHRPTWRPTPLRSPASRPSAHAPRCRKRSVHHTRVAHSRRRCAPPRDSRRGRR